MEELDIEDPLGRVYHRDEFEPFSTTEWGFISISCIGVITVPVLYLIVSRIQVLLDCFGLCLIIVGLKKIDIQRPLYLSYGWSFGKCLTEALAGVSRSRHCSSVQYATTMRKCITL
jgi:hypothetical protein